MQKFFKNTRCFIFLSNYIRNIIFIVIILSSYHLISYAQNAYINDFRVNDDVSNSSQIYSRIGVDSAGNFVIAWDDRRNLPGINWFQVYCQIFDKWGNRIGNNFRIVGLNDTTSLLGLTVLKDGRFNLVWINSLNGGINAELLFQRFDRFGKPIQPPARVVDSVFSSFELGFGDISSDSSGNFVIVWKRFMAIGNSSLIYCQRYDSAANRIGPLLIANNIFHASANDVNVEMNVTGSFIVSWSDLRNNLQGQKRDIFFQRFDRNGVKIGGNVLVNDDNDTTKEQSLPWMDLNRFGNGNFVITWTDERIINSGLMIYHQVFDSSGNFIGSNKRTDQSSGNPFASRVALDSNSRFIIGWSENWYAGRYQYYSRRYKANGDTLGVIYMIPQLSPPGSGQSPSDIKIWGDRVYSVWGDTRNGNPDVYCNVRSFQNPDTVIIGINPISNNLPGEYKCYPAYPNPFNPATTVKYSLPKKDDITIQLFDITGRLIRKWIYKDQTRGTYEMKIYNIYLSSGIYFLEFKANTGFKSTQRLVLIK